MVLAADDFETEADSVAEDQRRRTALEAWMPIVPPVGWLNIGFVLRRLAWGPTRRDVPVPSRKRALALVRKLDPDSGVEPTSLASAVAMRSIRVEVIGALLDALADYDNKDLCTITIVKPTWVFTPAELVKVSARTIKHALEQDLRRTGVMAIEGPLVGFLHGEYEATKGVYILHFHIVTTREKGVVLAARLRGLKRTYRPTKLVKRPIRAPRMKNRARQLTYMLKRYWPSRPVLMIDGKECRVRRTMRIPEPFSSVYLLWLDRQPFTDLTITNGCWSRRRDGSAAWKKFCLIVAGRGKTMASRCRSRSKSG